MYVERVLMGAAVERMMFTWILQALSESEICTHDSKLESDVSRSRSECFHLRLGKQSIHVQRLRHPEAEHLTSQSPGGWCLDRQQTLPDRV